MSPDMANVSASPQFSCCCCHSCRCCSAVVVVVVTVVGIAVFGAAIKRNSRWFLWFFKTFNNILRECYLSFISALPLLPFLFSLSVSLFLSLSTFLCVPFPQQPCCFLLMLLLFMSCSLPCRSARFVSFSATTTATIVLLVVLVCVCVCCRCAASGNNSVSSAIWRLHTHTHAHTFC